MAQNRTASGIISADGHGQLTGTNPSYRVRRDQR